MTTQSMSRSLMLAFATKKLTTLTRDSRTGKRTKEGCSSRFKIYVYAVLIDSEL